jgi:hypothetical protein
MTEHALQSAIIDLLQRCGALVIRSNSGRSGNIAYNRWYAGFDTLTKGAADVMALHDGVFYAIECKGAGGKVTPEQRRFLREVEGRGGVAIVARCLEDVSKALYGGNPAMIDGAQNGNEGYLQGGRRGTGRTGDNSAGG